MISYSDFHYYWFVLEFLNGIVISFLSAADIFVLYRHRIDRAPLVEWALYGKESKNNFSILLAASLLFILVFIVYAYGSLYGNYYADMLSELMGTVTYLMVSYVLVRWSKIFLRFA